MLEKLKIDGLFGLYSYTLDFDNSEDKRLSIITGPNGYGKTTVLQLVYALFDNKLDVLFSAPFAEFVLYLDDEVIRVKQSRQMSQVEEESDLPGEETVRITFELYDDKTGKTILSQEFTSDDIEYSLDGQLQLLLNSMKCFFLTDERVLHRKLENEIRAENADSDGSMQDVANKMARVIQGGKNEAGVSLFSRLVDYFKFADKELILDKTFGIRFRIKNASKTLIPVTSLSSGEKHLILQLYELIFESRSGDLVLIDEPELSFHPAWLNVYVSVLEKIQDFKLEEGREMQIILATHSPLLIGGRWDDTLDLYTLNENVRQRGIDVFERGM
jgi:predicted ATP-binding protein involved in virulence